MTRQKTTSTGRTAASLYLKTYAKKNTIPITGSDATSRSIVCAIETIILPSIIVRAGVDVTSIRSGFACPFLLIETAVIAGTAINSSANWKVIKTL